MCCYRMGFRVLLATLDAEMLVPPTFSLDWRLIQSESNSNLAAEMNPITLDRGVSGISGEWRVQAHVAFIGEGCLS